MVEDFNPYIRLKLEDDGSFNTKEIRQAYRRLAVKYHPDKVNKSIPREKALKRYQVLKLAYETLTKKQKFDNY